MITDVEGSGVLVVVFNYTGDRLNFGLAVERCRSMGMNVSYSSFILIKSNQFYVIFQYIVIKYIKTKLTYRINKSTIFQEIKRSFFEVLSDFELL